MTNAAIRSGILAESVTIGWMVIEAAIAIGAGLRAHSLLAIAFGLDSVIELFSGAALLWLFLHNDKNHAALQRRTAIVACSLLVVLCVYVATSAVLGIVRHVEPQSSIAAVGIAAAAVVLMPLLASWKRRINETLKNAALRADIAETVACAYMAAFVVIGLLAHRLLQIWWLEYAASGILLVWLIHEAREVFEELNESDAD